MTQVLVPRASGVLSAVGLIAAERRRDLVESGPLAGDDLDCGTVAKVVRRLAERGRDGARRPGRRDPRRPTVPPLRGPGLRAHGPRRRERDPDELRKAFDEAHDERYGYAPDPDASLELVTGGVAAALPAAELP